jgi:hypothetical protein
MKSVKLINVVIIVVFFAFFIYGQDSKCSKDVINKTSINGISLQMKFSKFLGHLGLGSKEQKRYKADILAKNDSGLWGQTFQIPADNQKLSSIKEIIVTFFDEKLVSYRIFYKNGVWKNENELAQYAINLFKLPSLEKWKTYREIKEKRDENEIIKVHEDFFYNYLLECEDYHFSVGKDYEGVYSFSLYSSDYMPIYQQRVDAKLKVRTVNN